MRLALSTTMRSSEYGSKTAQLNSGNSFNVTVTKSSGNTVIPVTTATPEGVVDAINKSSSGIKATLINKSATGNAWYIMLDGSLVQAVTILFLRQRRLIRFHFRQAQLP